jgi:hypothetical protein
MAVSRKYLAACSGENPPGEILNLSATQSFQ